MATKPLFKRLNASSFVKNSSWMVGGGGLQAGIAFVSNVVLARHLMPEDFGVFAIIQANINLSSAIINLKLEPLIIKLTNEDLKNQYSTITTIAIFQSFLNTVVGFVLLIIWDLVNAGAIILLIDKFFAPLVLLQLSLYERKLNYKRISLIETSSNTFSHLIAMVLAMLGIGPIALYIRVGLETAIRFFHLAWSKELKRMPVKIIHFTLVKNLIKSVKGFWLDAFLEASFERILILAGGYILTEKQLGYFVQAKRLAITPHQLFQPLAFRVSFNFFSKERNIMSKYLMLKKMLLLEFATLLSIAVIIFLFGEEIIKLLFGDKWIASAHTLRLMLGVITFLTLFNTYKSFYMSSGSMLTFFKFGRSIQFSVLLIALCMMSVGYFNMNHLDNLALSYSLSYIIPVVILIMYNVLKSVSFQESLIYNVNHKKKTNS